jgi:hypothetical protein
MPSPNRPFGETVITTQDDHPRLAATLIGMLKQQRATFVETIATRDAKDLAEYRFWRGQIDGLDIAISFAEKAQRQLQS